MKRIVVLTTGGTIATQAVGGRGATPRLRGADLLRAVPGAGSGTRTATREPTPTSSGGGSSSPTTCRGTRRA
jgi:L-asparaginase/Glu-tRNA(Gln) amidotransferase subunit D